MGLADLRRSRGLTQMELATILGPPWTQASISRFERQRDAKASTLASYLVGLDATLVLGAVFRDGSGYQRVHLGAR